MLEISTCSPPRPGSLLAIAAACCAAACAQDSPELPTVDAGSPSSVDAGSLADAGVTPPLCMDGRTFCEGRCVDLGSNAAHCGRCGQICAPDEVCAASACALPVIGALDPVRGPTAGGLSVRITGRLLDRLGDLEVRFGDQIAPILERSAEALVVEVPSRLEQPGVVDVTASSTGTWSMTLPNAFRYELTTLTFAPEDPIELAGEPRGLVVEDFDRDGHLDAALVTAGRDSLAILFGRGDGSFTEPTLRGITGAPSGLGARDLDRDGFVELVAFSASGQPPISVLSNQRNRTFGPTFELTPGMQMRGDLDFGDFDEDGRVDVIVGGRTRWVLARGLGDGTLTRGSLQGAAGTRGVAATDLDAEEDDHDDVLVLDADTNRLDVYFGRGDGSFASEASYDVGGSGGQGYLAVADLNGDGHQDVVTTTGGAVQVLAGSGLGVLSAPRALAAASMDSSVIEVVDIDSDGDPDLVVGARSGTDFTVFLNRGDAVFERMIIGGLNAPRFIGSGDFNEDGRMDLLVTEIGRSGPNRLHILLATGQ